MWAIQYIGLPWKAGATGPDEFDCWSFLRHVQKEHYGRTLPLFDVDANNLRAVMAEMRGSEERNNWERVDTPNDGDAVLMAHGKYPSHVGTWLNVDGGGVLHCVHGEGVVFSSMSELKGSGWGRVEYYRYVGNA